jgi:hypothetical protein
MVRFLKTKFEPFKTGWVAVVASEDENKNTAVFLKTEEMSVFEFIIAGRRVSPSLREWLEKTPPTEIAQYLFGNKEHPIREIASEWLFWKWEFGKVLSAQKTGFRFYNIMKYYDANTEKWKFAKEKHLPLNRYFFFTTLDEKGNTLIVPDPEHETITRLCLSDKNITCGQYAELLKEEKLCEWIESKVNA